MADHLLRGRLFVGMARGYQSRWMNIVEGPCQPAHQQQQLTLFIRATKPGEDSLAGVSTRRLVAVPFEG